MTEIDIQPVGIGDEQLVDAAPMVRALVVQRLEMIWRTCEPHISGSQGRPDPRFVEAGIRVLDRLCRLYRLDVPAGHVEDTTVTPEAVETFDARLGEIAARLR